MIRLDDIQILIGYTIRLFRWTPDLSIYSSVAAGQAQEIQSNNSDLNIYSSGRKFDCVMPIHKCIGCYLQRGWDR